MIDTSLDPLAIINRCRLFSRVDADRKAALAGIGRIQQVEKSTLLFRQGDRCEAMYVVGSGQARVFQIAPNGKEHTLYLAEAGNTFAEIAAIDGMPYPACAETISDCSLLALDTEGLSRLIEQDHALSRQLMLGLAMWVRHTVGLLEDVVLRDAVGRIAQYLRNLPDADSKVQLNASNVHVAKHLNLTPETLSRSFRRLESQGCIEHAGREVLILDRDLLDALADGMG